MSPYRVQRRREKGWRMPENTVYVGRPTRWGNEILPTMLDLHDHPLGVTRAVELYRLATERALDESPGYTLAPLRGKNLACYCPLDQPCHADVLLELANRT